MSFNRQAGEKGSSNKKTMGRTESHIMPVLEANGSMGKLLGRSMLELERLGQDKLMLEVKNRMAMLRAVEASLLR